MVNLVFLKLQCRHISVCRGLGHTMPRNADHEVFNAKNTSVESNQVMVTMRIVNSRVGQE